MWNGIVVKVKEDLTGKVFGLLTVLKQTNDYIDKNDVHYDMWECECSCKSKNIINVRGSSLRNKNGTRSCGCLQRNMVQDIGFKNKKYNKYDLSGEYGIGWTSNTNKEFYFDLEDYDKIKDYCWSEHKIAGMNYCALEARDPNTNNLIRMSNLIGIKNYDHINRNTLDNRKENFRQATNRENSINKNKCKRNTSGIIGVTYHKGHKKWVARINDSPYSRITILESTNKDEAIVARLNAEAQYYGEFAPQRHLFEQYGIKYEGCDNNVS